MKEGINETKTEWRKEEITEVMKERRKEWRKEERGK